MPEPSDPNSSLRNAPKGIVAHRVRQSLQFQNSLDSYDHEREKQVFGKNLLDVQAEGKIPIKPNAFHQNAKSGTRRRLTNVSNLEPQSSLLSY